MGHFEMAHQWFYEKNGNQYGPLDSHQMQALGKSGELGPNDLVWREGMQTKIPAAKYKGLLPQPSNPQSNPPEIPTEIVINSESKVQSQATSSRGQSGISGAALFSLGLEAQSFVYSNWITVVVLTIVFIVACASASAVIITLPLVPIFMMGYMSNLAIIRQGHGICWEEFISFLRRGWPALFNVFELSAVFILITAVVSAFVCICGMFCGFFSIIVGSFVGTEVVISFLVVAGFPVIVLALGAATAYWAIVYVAKDDTGNSESHEEPSIYSRLQLGLRAISANKRAVFSAGACIALFVLAYGIVLALIWFLAITVSRELPYNSSFGLMLRQLVGLVAVIVVFFLGSSGLASIFAFHAFVAERIVDHFRTAEE